MPTEVEKESNYQKLIETYSDMVYRIAFSRTQNVQDAQDITQEVFMKYLKYVKSGNVFREEEHRKAWFLKVAVNTGNSYIKTAWFRHRADFEEAYAVADDMTDTEEKHAVYYAVMALPEKYRITIHLFYYEELSVKEIGNILRLSETAVKSRLHRARMRLKEILKEEQYEF